MRRLIWIAALIVLAMLVAMPTLHTHAQATAGFTKIASVTTTSYTDTSCPKGGSCQYQVTATATGEPESGPSNTITVANTGTLGNVALTWQAGTCPTGKNCATPTGYNVYQIAPSVPPAGLAGVSQ